MFNAIKRTPSETGQYEFVISTDVDMYPSTEWAHDPDISTVGDVPRTYWKWDDANNIVIEMSQAEKDIVDDYGTDGMEDIAATLKVSISDNLPLSTIDGKKLAVHTSYKPEIEGHTTFAVWTGAGDDLTDLEGGIGNGELLNVQSEVGVPMKYVDIKFNPAYGRVWIHEAYVRFTGGGIGDHMCAEIVATGVPLQQFANLDLIVVDDFIKYSPSGPGTGTHGFASADSITLIERTFSKDGDWDYIGTGLVPNFYGLGDYKMSTVDTVVNRFVNKLPCYGDCTTYFSMSSDETSELRPNYYARMVVHNVSNTDWSLSAILEMYRVTTTL